MNRPWNEGSVDKPYTVSLWTDTPGETDTCHTGEDFATEKEARLAMADMDTHFPHGWDVPYILLDGPGLHEVTCRTAALKRVQREREADDRAARSETAMQAGMAFGVAGYNDAMGYDSEPYEADIHDNEDSRAYREWMRDQKAELEDGLIPDSYYQSADQKFGYKKG